MATLHLLSHSPFTDTRLASCLRVLGEQDAIFLTGDAVYALKAGTEWAEQLAGLRVFALAEDVIARGIVTSAPLMDYAGFVECCTQYAKVNSWL